MRLAMGPAAPPGFRHAFVAATGRGHDSGHFLATPPGCRVPSQRFRHRTAYCGRRDGYGGVLWLLVRVLTKYPRERAVVRPVLLLTALLVLQLCLGVISYIEKMAAVNAPQPLSPLIEITAAHVAVGALVLASSVVTTLQAFRNVASQCKAVGAPAVQEPERVAEAGPA